MSGYHNFNTALSMLPAPPGLIVYGAWANRDGGEWVTDAEEFTALAIVGKNQIQIQDDSSGKWESRDFTVAEMLNSVVGDYDTRFDVLFLGCEGLELLSDANDANNTACQLIRADDERAREWIKGEALQKAQRSEAERKKPAGKQTEGYNPSEVTP